MSETLTDTTEHDRCAPGADEATGEDLGHGRHRGHLAADDSATGDTHGRHRR